MGFFNRRKGGDRRSGKDRRKADASNYQRTERRKGMERRNGKDRRKELAAYKGLSQSQQKTAKRIVEALEYYDW